MARIKLDRGLQIRFLTKLANKAEKQGVICGNVTTKNWISKSVGKLRNSPFKGRVNLTYWIHMEEARVEWWIWCGKEREDVDSAFAIFSEYLLANKSEVERAYGGPLNWDSPIRKTAFSIQQDYPDFLLSDIPRWDYWIGKMLTDMKKLDDATRRHYQSRGVA